MAGVTEVADVLAFVARVVVEEGLELAGPLARLRLLVRGRQRGLPGGGPALPGQERRQRSGCPFL